MSVNGKQIETLRQIVQIHKELVSYVAENFPENRASEWFFLYHLTDTHKLDGRTLNALIRKGCLEKKPSDGFGPQVRISWAGHKLLEETAGRVY